MLTACWLAAQNIAVNADGGLPDASAILDLQAEDKGLLIPRLSVAQRIAIPEPATGLMIFQTDGDSGFYYYDGSVWLPLHGGGGGVMQLTDADGNAYPLVWIGDRLWMAENLQVKHFRNGDPIPLIAGGNDWAAASGPAMAAYNSMPGIYASTYGLLYNGYAITDERALCPDGWEIPAAEDWESLIDHLGEDAGGKMKALTWWEYPNTGGDNSSGFSAIPSGYRDGLGGYRLLYRNALFWGGGTENGAEATAAWLLYNSSALHSGQRSVREGLSVRCILKSGGLPDE